MPEYSYRYRSAETGRWRKRTAWADDEAALRAAIEAEGALEIADVAELPPEMASAAQLDYLRDLGGNADIPLTRWEASDCIDNALRGWQPAGESERRIAALYGVDVSRFASKHRVYDRISVSLAEGRDDARFAEWFVWRVYRNCHDRGAGAGIATPADGRIQSVARGLALDRSWLDGARRVARANKTGLRWFGVINGHNGESDASPAYRRARKALQDAGLIPLRRKAAAFDTPPPARKPAAAKPEKGVSGLRILLVTVVLAIVAFWIFGGGS